MTFEEAVEIILKKEGGYVNDPKDAGGETKYGISKRAYPKLNIKELTKDDAIGIYLADYWKAIGADNLPSCLRLIAFDAAVNQGVNYCKRELESLMQLTPLTPEGMVMEFKRRRELRYKQNKAFDRFGKGWLSRLDHITELTKNGENVS